MFKTLLVSLFAVALLAIPTATAEAANITSCDWRHLPRQSSSVTTDPTSPVLGTTPADEYNFFCFVGTATRPITDHLVNGQWVTRGGVMQTGWVFSNFGTGSTAGSGWFHFNARGEMSLGWTRVNGQWFFLDALDREFAAGNPEGLGVMLTGFQEELPVNTYDNGAPRGDTTAPFLLHNTGGQMRTGWVQVTDQNSVNGLVNGWYRFRGNGQVFGWTRSRGVYYFMDADTGLMEYGGIHTLPVSNRRLDSDITVNADHFASFLLNDNGAMQVGVVRTNITNGRGANPQVTYVTRPNGSLVHDAWFRVANQGWFRTGADLTGPGYRAFTSGINLVTDLDADENEVDRLFHFNNIGLMSTGWVRLAGGITLPGGEWYTFPTGTFIHAAANGELAVNTWRNIGGNWFYFSGFWGVEMASGEVYTTGYRPNGAPENGLNEFIASGNREGRFVRRVPVQPTTPPAQGGSGND